MSAPRRQPRLNYPYIHARIAALGLGATLVTAMLGIRLPDLEHDLDQRFVSLAVMVRLSQLLDCTLDDLVAEQPPPAATDAPEVPGDDAIVATIAASYAGITIEGMKLLLGWTDVRLDAAIGTLENRLADTMLKLIVTDTRIALGLRVTLDEDTSERLDVEQRTRRPMDPDHATGLLNLITRKILSPFPEDPDDDPERPIRAFTAVQLLLYGLAVLPDDRATRPEVAEPHPDVMFALGLIDATELDTGTEPHWTMLL